MNFLFSVSLLLGMFFFLHLDFSIFLWDDHWSFILASSLSKYVSCLLRPQDGAVRLIQVNGPADVIAYQKNTTVLTALVNFKCTLYFILYIYECHFIIKVLDDFLNFMWSVCMLICMLMLMRTELGCFK